MSNPRGRPTVMTPENIAALEAAFAFGATDVQACHHVGIARSVYAEYKAKNSDWCEKIEGIKSSAGFIAKQNIVHSIQKGNIEDSKWYLERKEKSEYSTRQENTGADGAALFGVQQVLEDIDGESAGLPEDQE